MLTVPVGRVLAAAALWDAVITAVPLFAPAIVWRPGGY